MTPEDGLEPAPADGEPEHLPDNRALRPEMLVALLEQEIQMRTGRRVRGLSVSYQDGRMVVYGQVTCYYVKQLVLAAVTSFLGEGSAEACLELEVVS